MRSLKKLIINVRPYNDYASVTEIYGDRKKFHSLSIKNSPKRNFPFVVLKQDLPPYWTMVIRLDKLGFDEEHHFVNYEYYFEE